jgi:hypothetical protein
MEESPHRVLYSTLGQDDHSEYKSEVDDIIGCDVNLNHASELEKSYASSHFIEKEANDLDQNMSESPKSPIYSEEDENEMEMRDENACDEA